MNCSITAIKNRTYLQTQIWHDISINDELYKFQIKGDHKDICVGVKVDKFYTTKQNEI
jgi:hypothetical protein